ncbi:MAG TPA: glycosyltransferase [Deltaproteobacteria bacterium]|nr:glycosyltransferase [Deltaproteobacteria bacterium]
MHPIKILHLISTTDIGGAERNLQRLVYGMDGECFNNTVVSMTTVGSVGGEIQENGIPVFCLGMEKGMPDPRGMLKLKHLIDSFKPDIIQCWMYHANLFGLLFSHKRPLVWNIRCSDMDLSRYGLIYKYTVKAGAVFSKIPDAVIANSFAGRKYHESLGYRPRRWEVIPNGFDTELFKPDTGSRTRIRVELGIPEHAPVIGLIARYDPMKDHATFFHAARTLMQIHPAVHFVLAGQGIAQDNPELHRLIGDQLNSSQIHLLSQRNDVPDVLNALDIATSSSLSEGLPNTIGEAMATGIPCVVTDVGDSRILVGETGYVVESNNPAEMSAAWTRLLDTGAKHLHIMGGKARERIQQHYSLLTATKSYEILYSGLMERP